VPGAPWQSTAAGTLALLRDGATPCVDTTDILLALGIDPGEPRHDDPPLTPEAARLLGCVRRDAGPERVAVARCGLGGRSAARALHDLEHARLIERRDDGWLVPIA
jgi:predicted Rossmann fold nucleotide-binding protein DprA/Smf involved in DNA uptake